MKPTILITTLRFCPKKQYIKFKRKRRMHAAENPRVAVKISAKIITAPLGFTAVFLT
jgi:hypothetical protein